MINTYKSFEGKFKKINQIEKDSWIELISPTMEEIDQIVTATSVDQNILLRLLDEEEIPRVEVEDNLSLIVVDVPYMITSNYKNKYHTYPLGIIVCEHYFITISVKELTLFDDFKNNKIKDIDLTKKKSFTLQILLKISYLYQKYLKVINTDINNREKHLQKSTNNKELLDLLNIEKNLVYFINSLKGNDVVLDKLSKGNILVFTGKEIDILEDVVVENKQAIEMATIYKEILTSMTDTYATIVSNNLNLIMKFLAGITIVFSIPTMITSFFGMNVSFGSLGEFEHAAIIIIGVSIIIAIIIAYLLKKKDML